MLHLFAAWKPDAVKHSIGVTSLSWRAVRGSCSLTDDVQKLQRDVLVCSSHENHAIDLHALVGLFELVADLSIRVPCAELVHLLEGTALLEWNKFYVFLIFFNFYYYCSLFFSVIELRLTADRLAVSGQRRECSLYIEFKRKKLLFFPLCFCSKYFTLIAPNPTPIVGCLFK